MMAMDRLPSFFGRTYLVNLPERVDRLKLVRRQLARAGWEIGPTGVHIFPARRFAQAAGFPSAPIRGCFHSHLECLRAACADACRSVLILEDDVALSPSLPRLTPSIKQRLEIGDWDFVYFAYGGISTDTAGRDTTARQLKFAEWIDETDALSTTAFYAVNGRILPRLIDHLEKISNGRAGDREAGPMPVDGAYNVFRRNNPDVRCLIADPKLGWQSSSRSDISPHALDKVVFLRPINGVLRKFKRFGGLWRL
jgi:glycosyl transferase family 25